MVSSSPHRSRYIMKFGVAPHCRSLGQRANDEELTKCEQVDECLQTDHPGIYRRRLDVNGCVVAHHCAVCKKGTKPFGKEICKWEPPIHTSTSDHAWYAKQVMKAAIGATILLTILCPAKFTSGKPNYNISPVPRLRLPNQGSYAQ